MKEVIVAEEKKRQNEEIKKKVVEVEGTPTEQIKEEEKYQKAKKIVESFGIDYEFDDEDLNENPLSSDIGEEFLEGVDSMDNIDEPQEKEDDTDEWDEDHALDMVMNEMVEDLMEEENVDTIEELIEVLEDESIVEDIEEEKEDDSPTTKQDVTINNKPPKRKMGIDRIR